MQINEFPTQGIITGNYEFPDDYVLDMTFDKREFKDCFIRGGSLSCSVFNNCIFDDVIFEDVNLQYVSFNDCTVKKLGFR